MALENSESLVRMDDVKDIRIKHFSSTDQCGETHEYFVLKRNPFFQIFCVSIHPNGMSSKTQGFVSVQIFKVLRDPDSFLATSRDSLSWTLSVVDSNGVAKYYQSYVKENVVHFPYNMVVSDFLDRSILLKQADELLPSDVLTVRCELSCMFYSSSPTTEPELPRRMWVLENIKPSAIEDWNKDNDFQPNQNGVVSDGIGHVELELGKMMSTTLDTMMMALVCRMSNMDSAGLEFQKNLLTKSDPTDEVRRTYLGSNKLFKTYIGLKNVLKKVLDDERPLSERSQPKDALYFGKLYSMSLGRKKYQLMEMLDLMVKVNDGHPPVLTCLSWSSEKNTTVQEQILSKSEVKWDEGEELIEVDNQAPTECDEFLSENNECENITQKKECLPESSHIKTEQTPSHYEVEETEKTTQDHQILKENNKQCNEEKNERIIQESSLRIKKETPQFEIKFIEKESCVEDDEEIRHEGKNDVKEKTILKHPVEVKNQEELSQSEIKNGQSDGKQDKIVNVVCLKAGEVCQLTNKNEEIKISQDIQQQMEDESNSCRNSMDYQILSDNDDIQEAMSEAWQQSNLEEGAIGKAEMCQKADEGLQFSKEDDENEETVDMDMTSENEESDENEVESEINYVQEAIEYLLSESPVDEDPYSECESQEKWKFFIQTNEGVVFTLPFDNGKETLGSKLVAGSPVFESMLRNPMLEKLHRWVKLVDVNCYTFINFLLFLQTKQVKTESFSELCAIYEFADKYQVTELMLLCAEKMRPSFSPGNLGDVELLAFLHSDDYPRDLVEAFKIQNKLLQLPASEPDDKGEQVEDEPSVLLDEQVNEMGCDFYFYS
ncbi:uncharacterized protein CDAR_291701 [Caerostris darwini]|uniref:BTB domain-containing protein n=1 Tax=Caerostris darwini TaxID=1538125 RepID=A0AAV4MVZ3_9ARAC|nr:uncharacterized protein CDAR_291701 [Caerostris darwini]